MKENTYIFFTADHGLGVGHHSLLGKQNLYEHSTRVPFIVSGPESQKIKFLFLFICRTLYSTLAGTGVEKPEHVRFKNIMPLISGRTSEPPPKEIYGAYLDAQRSITVEVKNY